MPFDHPQDRPALPRGLRSRHFRAVSLVKGQRQPQNATCGILGNFATILISC
jgi:hypothetical protein